MTFRGIGIFLLFVVPALLWYLLFNTGQDALSLTRELVKDVNSAHQNAEGDAALQAKLPEKQAAFYTRFRLPSEPESPAQRAQFNLLWTAVASCQTPELGYTGGSSSRTETREGARCFTRVRGAGMEAEPVTITLGWVGHQKRWDLSAFQVGQAPPVALASVR